MQKLKRAIIRELVNPRGRNSFIEKLPPKARVLDVGCGHNSPKIFKSLRPDIFYAGIDVGDCHQLVDPRTVADQYEIVTSSHFAAGIAERFENNFDAVVSAHNLEHCEDQETVLTAMIQQLKMGGMMYLAFPAAASLNFPMRHGSLNFCDDPTHGQIPDFHEVLDRLQSNGMEIIFQTERYRPPVKVAVGLLLEPLSALRKKVLAGTQALYGFESVIWARRSPNASPVRSRT